MTYRSDGPPKTTSIYKNTPASKIAWKKFWGYKGLTKEIKYTRENPGQLHLLKILNSEQDLQDEKDGQNEYVYADFTEIFK